MDLRASEREEMVRTQIQARGIKNPLVLDAMNKVPRHLFVPKSLAREAYRDYPLPIGEGQTISQPYIVGVMTELIDPRPGDRILEIGSGSGYQAAVLAECGATVFTIERIKSVADLAEKNLKLAGIGGVTVICGDGTVGYPQMEPYDGILITAATPEIPAPLVSELGPDGILVAPVGQEDIQYLVRLIRRGDDIITEQYGAVRFVPLIGRHGWKEENKW